MRRGEPQAHRQVDPIDAVQSGADGDDGDDLLEVAALVHDLRSTYLPDRPLPHKQALAAYTEASPDPAGVGPGRYRRGRKARGTVGIAGGFVATLTGKVLLGAVAAGASVGGLQAAHVIEVPELVGLIGLGRDEAPPSERQDPTPAGEPSREPVPGPDEDSEGEANVDDSSSGGPEDRSDRPTRADRSGPGDAGRDDGADRSEDGGRDAAGPEAGESGETGQPGTLDDPAGDRGEDQGGDVETPTRPTEPSEVPGPPDSPEPPEDDAPADEEDPRPGRGRSAEHRRDAREGDAASTDEHESDLSTRDGHGR